MQNNPYEDEKNLPSPHKHDLSAPQKQSPPSVKNGTIIFKSSNPTDKLESHPLPVQNLQQSKSKMVIFSDHSQFSKNKNEDDPLLHPTRKKVSLSRPRPRSSHFSTLLKTSIAISLILLLASLGFFFIYVSKLVKNLPEIENLERFDPNLITRVYDDNGQLLKEFFTERRIMVPLQEIPPELVNAVKAAEDKDFHRHWGINIYGGILRAFTANLLKTSSLQGGSSLTQQLAKNIYFTPEMSIKRKIKEALTAIQIEKKYTKDEILEFYLNQIYLGSGAFGVQAASQKYLSKNIGQISLSECALFAGMIKSPENFRPDRNFTKAIQRRNQILKSMFSDGFIEKQDYAQAIQESIILTMSEESEGFAPYFVENVRKYIEKAETLMGDKKFGKDYLYKNGIGIYSTLNLNLQRIAENSVHVQIKDYQMQKNREFVISNDSILRLFFEQDSLALREIIGSGLENIAKKNMFFHLKNDSAFLLQDSLYIRLNAAIQPVDSLQLKQVQACVVMLETKTGKIKAMVGGRSFKESKFNRATQALRQPGSAFKPFVFACAIDNGFTAVSQILDQPIVLKTDDTTEWRPENYTRKFSGPTTLRNALVYSKNLVAIQLLNKVGAWNVIKYAQRIGIESKLTPVPSLAIGSCEVTPLEIVSAYSAFGNNGIRPEPYMIEKILDKDGNLIEEHSPLEHEVLPAATAYIITNIMQDVIKRGTGQGIWARGFRRSAAGKTGTTNDYSDAWFIGFTPYYTLGVWVGLDERRTIGEHETGARAALPIWTEIMTKTHEGLAEINFSIPENIIKKQICTDSWKLATTHCPKSYDEVFKEGSEPLENCPLDHQYSEQEKEKSHDPFGIKKPFSGRKKGRQLIF